MSVTKEKKLLKEGQRNTSICHIICIILLLLLVLANTMFIFFLWDRVDLLAERLSQQQNFSQERIILLEDNFKEQIKLMKSELGDQMLELNKQILNQKSQDEQNMMNNMKEWMDIKMSGLNISEPTRKASEKANQIFEDLKKRKEEIGENLQGIWKQTKTKTEGAFKEAKIKASEKTSQLLKELQSKREVVGKTLDDAWSTTKEKTGQTFEKAKQKWKELEVEKVLKEKTEKAQQKLGEWFSFAKDTLSSYTKDL